MFSLRSLFKTNPEVEIAKSLYGASILAARRPYFFVECGVPDSPEGRFEMLALSAFLVLNRLKKFENLADLSQTYFDVMFDDIDSNLRELGVSDISVGKKVKKLAQSFYGRIKSYEAGLEDETDEALHLVINRDLLRGTEAEKANIEKLAKYVRAEHEFLSRQDSDSLGAGKVSFVDLSDVFK